jgi:hypothetical protein
MLEWSSRVGHMQRREFISLLGGAAVAWPRATAALDNRKLYRIGYLGAEAAYTD